MKLNAFIRRLRLSAPEHLIPNREAGQLSDANESFESYYQTS